MIYIDGERINPETHPLTKELWAEMVKEYPGIVDKNQPPVTVCGVVEAHFDRITKERKGSSRRHVFYRNNFLNGVTEHEIAYSEQPPSKNGLDGTYKFPASERTILINGTTELTAGKDASKFFYLWAFSGQVKGNKCDDQYRSNTQTVKIVSYDKEAKQRLEARQVQSDFVKKITSGEWDIDMVKTLLRQFNYRVNNQTEDMLRMDLVDMLEGKKSASVVAQIQESLLNDPSIELYAQVRGLVDGGDIAFDRETSYWRQVDPNTKKLGANICRASSVETKDDALRSYVRQKPHVFNDILGVGESQEESPQTEAASIGEVVV